MLHSKEIMDTVCLEITSADTAAVLQRISSNGISLYKIEDAANLTVRLYCSKRELKAIRKLTEKTGGSIRIVTTRGPGDLLHHILHRPIMAAAFVLLMILVFFLPTRVLFIRVEGNSTIPTNRILEAAEESGICFGAARRQIRSESVKNTLLGRIPELQWVGINTSGCVATVSVREKSIEQNYEQKSGPGSIIACTDGIIRSCTVTNGTAVCRIGDAVVAGQTLVSGYTDCGITIKAVRAQAEVTACTLHSLTAVAPSEALSRSSQIRTETKYSIRIGKKLINFFKDSGISDTTCVKMYSEACLILPGGFSLPVALITQENIYYSVTPAEVASPEKQMEDYCSRYLLSQMQAGEILSQASSISRLDGLHKFSANYVCLEMIGQFVNEEIVNNVGQTN